MPNQVCQITGIMKRLSSRQILALVLGVFLALGMSLSAVQAGENAVQMATMADDSGASDQGGCDDCGGSGDDHGALACPPILSCSIMAAVLPVERSLVASHAAEVYFPVSNVARDLTAPPEPYPPRLHGLD